MKISELTANYLFLLEKGLKCEIVNELDDVPFIKIYDNSGVLCCEIGYGSLTEEPRFIYGCIDKTNDIYNWAYLWTSYLGFTPRVYETQYDFIRLMFENSKELGFR